MSSFRKPPQPKTADEFINASCTHTKRTGGEELTRSSFQLPKPLLRAARVKSTAEGIPLAQIIRQALQAYVSSAT